LQEPSSAKLGFGALQTAQFPDIELFGPVLGIPFDFQVVAKLIEFVAMFKDRLLTRAALWIRETR
jgi:hypothetical protein